MLCNCTVKDMWIDVLDRLPESGQEVLCYFILDQDDINEDGKPEPYYATLTYYKKGKLINYAMDYDIASPEERFLDSIVNKDNERIANEDGFYVLAETTYRHGPTVIAWLPLERPNNCTLD